MDLQLQEKTAENRSFQEKISELQMCLSHAHQKQEKLEAHIAELNIHQRSLLDAIAQEKATALESENRYTSIYDVNETLLRFFSDGDSGDDGEPIIKPQELLLINNQQKAEIEQLQLKIDSQTRFLEEMQKTLQQVLPPPTHIGEIKSALFHGSRCICGECEETVRDERESSMVKVTSV
jgi:DNA repair exonuclease SbcCD ATPase subunit